MLAECLPSSFVIVSLEKPVCWKIEFIVLHAIKYTVLNWFGVFIPFHSIPFHSIKEWNYTEEQNRPQFHMCVCSQNVSLVLAPKLPDRFRWNFKWRLGQVCCRLTTTQIVPRSGTLRRSDENVSLELVPNLSDRFRWNSRWRLRQVCCCFLITQIVPWSSTLPRSGAAVGLPKSSSAR